MYVRNGKDALMKVMADADAIKLEVETISFSRASLDDVFLKYTGKSLENKKEESEAEPWWKKWQKSGQGSDEWKKWQKTEEEGEGDMSSSEKEWSGQGEAPDSASGWKGNASPSAEGGSSEQGEREGEASSGSAGEGGNASPSESTWQSGKWSEAEMKEWWAKKSKAK